jgi:hypothetical protein
MADVVVPGGITRWHNHIRVHPKRAVQRPCHDQPSTRVHVSQAELGGDWTIAWEESNCWELSGTGEARQRRALQLIGGAFALLAVYLAVQSTLVLVTGYHPRHSLGGIVWTAITAQAMFALAAGKARTGASLGNPVLRTEGRVRLVDGLLAVAVLAGLMLNAAAGWWWADPVAGYVLLAYAAREVYTIFLTSGQ